MKYTLSLFLFCLLSLSAFAQLQVVDANGNVLTSPITVNGAADPNSLPAPASPVGTAVKTYLKVKNTGANTVNVKVKFTRTTTADGHQNNYFCWGQSCYNSSTLESPNSVSLASGSTTNTLDHCIVYLSGSQADTSPRWGGNSSFDYTFYDSANPNTNTVTIRVNFVISGTTSIEDLGVSGVHFKSAFPNPSTGKLTIKAEGIEKARQTAFELYTPQGKKMADFPLQNWQNDQHELALPALPRGMYLYRYAVDGKRSKVEKLVIE